MKKIIKSKIGIMILSVYMAAVLCICLAYVMPDEDNEQIAYAMTDNEHENALIVHARTVGSNIKDSADINDYTTADEVNIYNTAGYDELQHGIMNEQYQEVKAVEAMSIRKPDLVVNGLKTVYRDRIKLNSRDKAVLNRIVEAEAGGEDISGRMLVANVVINRVKSSHHPDNVKDVVFAHSGTRYQFSPVKDGRYYKVKISGKTKKAVRRVLNGEDNSSGALYFICRRLANRSNARWFDSSLTYLFAHGCHEFFKK